MPTARTPVRSLGAISSPARLRAGGRVVPPMEPGAASGAGARRAGSGSSHAMDLGRETETSHPTFEPSLHSSGVFGIGSSTHLGESEPPRVVYGPRGQVLSGGRRPIGFRR
jgi:hypothetical protein